MGQSGNLVPAERSYCIRDVTATVDNIQLHQV